MLSIVVPCYNEQETVPLLFEAIERLRPQIKPSLEYIFVNDGSTDGTLRELRHLAERERCVRYISFSRHFGKEAALYAGLQAAKGSLVTVMDADLQDPPELLPRMIAMIESTNLDCVGTRRINREGEPRLRSFFARQFYRLINRISSTQMVDGARDYRLMTRQMVDAVLRLSEYNRFSKGLFSWVGFETEYISYPNRERAAGKTSWSFWKLFNYSLDGIVNFSEAPLNIASFVGGLSCLASAVALIFIVVRALIWHNSAAGWPSLVSIILLLGGLQLLSLGIIGRYIGKIFLETKQRPIYIVKETEKSNRPDQPASVMSPIERPDEKHDE
ncbi:glycosyltransferase family 2 protein [Lacticaseibacillus jixianensis]|uniref:Glycosyltransferase family 2 protein n=1 Tax=Lacticaseibacillus jixianensis TaxID=2486012 RepID=A0ABW4BCM7_9LACO|nr:glycosyltransferase family 2 protein [Lacticaseibacillus jixianensis]